MQAITKKQIENLELTPGHPLLICDVDEVVVHFTRDFERYLDERNLWLDAVSLALNGNIRKRGTNTPVDDRQAMQLVSDFFRDRTLHMETIEGAVEALTDISADAQIVMLTNLPHESGDHRRQNLARHGLPFPVITNGGPKGPAIAALSGLVSAPTIFIDDSPGFIASAYEHAPYVHLIHFMHDERFARHVRPHDFVSLFTGNWNEARAHIGQLLSVQAGT
jgi:hypothetical protein